MYIPTQEERYSKKSTATLLLCVIAPSAVILGLMGVTNLMLLLTAFVQPLAFLIEQCGLSNTMGIVISSLLQAILFFMLARTKKFSPKRRLTIAIVWGMSLALTLKLIIVFAQYLGALNMAQQ